MKKLLAIALTALLILSFAACDGGDAPVDTTDTTADGTAEEGNGTAGEQGDNQTPSLGGALSQAQMEAEILRRLAGISDLKALTLCGGETITYTPDGMIMAGDWWIIEKPTVGKEEFLASVEAQLSAAGFTAESGLLGTDYTVKAGPGSIGINIWYDSDANEITLRTTNHRDEYNMAFIEAENQKLPTIIESIDIMEKLPENFSVSYTTSAYKYTVCRYNGGYLVSSEFLDQTESDMIYTSFNVAVPKEGGDFTYYTWYDILYPDSGEVKKGKPQEQDHFGTTSTPLEEQLQKIMENLSLWGRMCWDYKALPVDGDRFLFDKACGEYSITENLTKVGTETILGRNCEKVHSEGLWAPTVDLVFDLETGMVMYMNTTRSDASEAELLVEVTAYDPAPTSLGGFVQP